MEKKREQIAEKIYKIQQRKFSHISKNTYFVAGLMLYLAEGDKKNETRIVLANTDIQIIKLFIKWMIVFLSIKKQDIKAQLHLYENMDILQEENFWRKGLDLNRKQFYKTQIRKLRKSSFSYHESYRHGTCSVYVLGVEKKRNLMMGIKAFLEKF